MAEGLNKVLLIGNLGQNPELRYTQSNQPVLSLRLATNERYQDRSGEWQERTEWHSVTVWGKRGEGLSKVLAKGSQLFVEGRLQTRSWEDRQGQKRYTTEVVANSVILLGKGRGAGEERGDRGGRLDDRNGDAGSPRGGGSDDEYSGGPAEGPGGPEAEFAEDEIPF